VLSAAGTDARGKTHTGGQPDVVTVTVGPKTLRTIPCPRRCPVPKQAFGAEADIQCREEQHASVQQPIRTTPAMREPRLVGILLLGALLLSLPFAACTPKSASIASLPATASPSGTLPSAPSAPQSVSLLTPSVTPPAKTVRVTIVFDNNEYDPRLQTGWGFACWLEYGDHVLLFDTGGSGAILLNNMAKLRMDPQRIEIVVLSHDHGDHTYSLADLLSVHGDLAAYMPQSFAESYRS